MITFARKRAIVTPVLSFKERTVAFVTIMSEITVSDIKDTSEADAKKGAKKKEPAHVCQVRNLEDGCDYTLICPTLLVTALTEHEGDYVGKSYEINVSAQPRAGKAYKDVTVYEINPKPEADHDEIETE